MLEMVCDVLKYWVICIEWMLCDLCYFEVMVNCCFLIMMFNGIKKSKGFVFIVFDGGWDVWIFMLVVFMEDGFLLDGQYCFVVCVLFGQLIEVLVIMNGQWGIFFVFDMGCGCNVGQFFGEVFYVDVLVVVVKFIFLVIWGIECSEWIVVDVFNQEIYELVYGWLFFYEIQEDSGSWMKYIFQVVVSWILQSVFVVLVMMVLVVGVSLFDVVEFLEGLKFGYCDGFLLFGMCGEDLCYFLCCQYLNKKGVKKFIDKDCCDQVSYVCWVMEVWLEYKVYQCGEVGVKVIELEKFQVVVENVELFLVWGVDWVCEFYNERVF